MSCAAAISRGRARACGPKGRGRGERRRRRPGNGEQAAGWWGWGGGPARFGSQGRPTRSPPAPRRGVRARANPPRGSRVLFQGAPIAIGGAGGGVTPRAGGGSPRLDPAYPAESLRPLARARGPADHPTRACRPTRGRSARTTLTATALGGVLREARPEQRQRGGAAQGRAPAGQWYKKNVDADFDLATAGAAPLQAAARSGLRRRRRRQQLLAQRSKGKSPHQQQRKRRHAQNPHRSSRRSGLIPRLSPPPRPPLVVPAPSQPALTRRLSSLLPLPRSCHPPPFPRRLRSPSSPQRRRYWTTLA